MHSGTKKLCTQNKYNIFLKYKQIVSNTNNVYHTIHLYVSIEQINLTRSKIGFTEAGEPELTLIILTNIHYAKEQTWGNEFRAAMATIRKQYTYDYVHNATSMKFILKELAGADELRNMKLAPAPNVNKANAVQKYKSTLEEASHWSNSSLADSSMSSYP